MFWRYKQSTAFLNLQRKPPNVRKPNNSVSGANADLQKTQHETSLRQMAQVESVLHSALKSSEELQRKVVTERSAMAETTGLNSGGYIIFDMPDAKKGMFHDLLKGFEDYAQLRGYIITFSIDNYLPTRSPSSSRSTAAASLFQKASFAKTKGIIEKVQRGDSLDDLPVILPAEEQQRTTCDHEEPHQFLAAHLHASEKYD